MAVLKLMKVRARAGLEAFAEGEKYPSRAGHRKVPANDVIMGEPYQPILVANQATS